MHQAFAVVFPLPVMLALAAVLIVLLLVAPVLLALRRPGKVRHPVLDEHAAHPGADRA